SPQPNGAHHARRSRHKLLWRTPWPRTSRDLGGNSGKRYGARTPIDARSHHAIQGQGFGRGFDSASPTLDSLRAIGRSGNRFHCAIAAKSHLRIRRQKLMNENIEEVYREIRTDFKGALLRPGDLEYGSAAPVWNGMFDRSPGILARCSDVADIQ